jgi:hypothetical protein
MALRLAERVLIGGPPKWLGSCANSAARRTQRRLSKTFSRSVGQLSLLDVSGLLAATFSVVFKHEADLVALVERKA